MELEFVRKSLEGEKLGPFKLMLSPTDHCNLRCRTCWRLEKSGRYDEMSGEEMKRIMREAREIGTKVLDLTGGGEPFLRKDMIDLMEYGKKLGFFCTLTTNGTLLNEEKIERIVNIGWDDICFSLDGASKKTNDYIRGEGTYEKVIHTIKKFQEVKRKMGKEKPILRLSTVITSKNYEELEGIIELASELGVKAIYFSPLFEWESNKELWVRGVEEDRMKRCLKEAEEVAKDLGIDTNLRYLLEFGVLEHEKPKFCFAPWYMLFINASGEAMVCCTLATLHFNIVGNIKERSLEELWFGERMEAFRKRVKEGKLFKECERCLPDFTHKFNEWYEVIFCNSRK